MDETDYLLLVEGVPVCSLPAEQDFACSLQAWSQAFGVAVPGTQERDALEEGRGNVRFTVRNGQLSASVVELAVGMGLQVAIDPRTRLVTVWKPLREGGEASFPLPPLLRRSDQGRKIRRFRRRKLAQAVANM